MKMDEYMKKRAEDAREYQSNGDEYNAYSILYSVVRDYVNGYGEENEEDADETIAVVDVDFTTERYPVREIIYRESTNELSVVSSRMDEYDLNELTTSELQELVDQLIK